MDLNTSIVEQLGEPQPPPLGYNWVTTKAPGTIGGLYIIWDGYWQRRVKWMGNKTWKSVRGYPTVLPHPIAWRKDDPEWSRGKDLAKQIKAKRRARQLYTLCA